MIQYATTTVTFCFRLDNYVNIAVSMYHLIIITVPNVDAKISFFNAIKNEFASYVVHIFGGSIRFGDFMLL